MSDNNVFEKITKEAQKPSRKIKKPILRLVVIGLLICTFYFEMYAVTQLFVSEPEENTESLFK